jgi:hypothetical protein
MSQEDKKQSAKNKVDSQVEEQNIPAHKEQEVKIPASIVVVDLAYQD